MSNTAVTTPKRRRGRLAVGKNSIESLALFTFNNDKTSVNSTHLSENTTPFRNKDGAASAQEGVHNASTDPLSPVRPYTILDDNATTGASTRTSDPFCADIKIENGENNERSSNLFERASALTKISGIEVGSPIARDASGHLLLERCSVTEPQKARKKRSTKKTSNSLETEATTSTFPPKQRTPNETLLPFWLSSPKDVKDIDSFHKTLCSRLSQIEKQMKRFEAERQGLLNVLYQFNMQGPSHGTSASAPKNDNAEQVLQGADPSIVSTSNVDTTLPAAEDCVTGKIDTANGDTGHAKTDERQHKCNQPSTPICDDMDGNNGEVANDISIPNDDGIHPISKKGDITNNSDIDAIQTEGQASVSKYTTNISVSIASSPPTYTTTNDRVNNEVASLTEDYSQHMLQSIEKLSKMLDNDLEFYGGSHMDRNAVDYNAGNFMESSTRHEFRMWHSCWLKEPGKESPQSPALLTKRPPGNARIHRHAVQPSPPTDTNIGQEGEGDLQDVLEYYWNLDFQSLSKHQLTMLAQFFGLKTSLSSKTHIEEMEKIRSYLIDFSVK